MNKLLFASLCLFLGMAQSTQAMNESPDQLISRVSTYVLSQQPQTITEQDYTALHVLISDQEYLASIRDILDANTRNIQRYTLTSEQAQYLECLIYEAQSARELIFADVPGQQDLWDIFMHVDQFFRGNDSIESVQLFKRWQERNALMSQQ